MTTDARSQFVASGGGPSQQKYFESSLGLMCADTRSGITPQAAADLSTLERFASTHPDHQARVTGYAERMHKAAGSNGDAKHATIARAKPVTTMK